MPPFAQLSDSAKWPLADYVLSIRGNRRGQGAQAAARTPIYNPRQSMPYWGRTTITMKRP